MLLVNDIKSKYLISTVVVIKINYCIFYYFAQGWTQVAVGERFEGCRGSKAHLTIEEDVLRPEYTKFVEQYMDPTSALFVLYDFSVIKVENVKTKIIGIQWYVAFPVIKLFLVWGGEIVKSGGYLKVIIHQILARSTIFDRSKCSHK